MAHYFIQTSHHLKNNRKMKSSGDQQFNSCSVSDFKRSTEWKHKAHHQALTYFRKQKQSTFNSFDRKNTVHAADSPEDVAFFSINSFLKLTDIYFLNWIFFFFQRNVILNSCSQSVQFRHPVLQTKKKHLSFF